MSEPFEYAVLRAVPRVDRGEFVNVGVLLYSQAADFLDIAVHVDDARLQALDPRVDLDAVHAALEGIRRNLRRHRPPGPGAVRVVDGAAQHRRPGLSGALRCHRRPG